MAKRFTAEEILEKRLINQLELGESQWTYEPDIKNQEDLWDNFRDILEKNNKAKLEGVPLTDQEFSQIKDQLNFSSFYKAGQWLAGENGIAKVDVQREDARLGTVRLDVFKRRDKAGGSSVYQVVNQVGVARAHDMGRDSRFDVTLLFNGLPLIHIELKNKSVSYMEAFRQVEGYIKNGAFRGLYSCVQVFVLSNGTSTRYISANRKLKSQFLTRWVDEDNKPVDELIDFASKVLRIPESHELVTDYTVLDHAKKSLIVLRPYQIHAIKAVKEAVRKRESGYVWHTTGSGKTLTSYKVARNLLNSPSLDKSIFIVDRVDLDQQTSSSFMSYAVNDTIEIDETANVSDLADKLLTDDRTVLVTTIQKLNYLMKEARENPNNKKLAGLRQLDLTFIVDECHRAISPAKQAEIKEFFPSSLWYGFTGTPIFKENAREAMGDLARTTEEQYGRRLHEYTVKEAIKDKAVLGFQVEYKTTIDEDSMMDIVEAYNPGIGVSGLQDKDLEARIPDEYFEEDGHKLKVIDYIVNKATRKFNLHKGQEETFNAILTCSSIAEAQRYYELFREVKAGTSQVKVSDRTKKLMADFPKVAITYSLGVNQEASQVNQDKMAQALEDYNAMYGTSFSLATIKGYNTNLNDRLARKKEIYQSRPEQIDLVIVVDRLLTGFDAPCLAILFMDRNPMIPQGLIQAFSRTNRIYSQDKTYGQIVIFRKPATYKEEVDEAFVLYSNGGENYIQAPSWEESQEAFIRAISNLREIAPTPQACLKLHEEYEKVNFVRAFQAFDQAFAQVQVYSDFDEDTWEEDYKLTYEEIEDYHGHYVNIKADLQGGENPPLDLIDIDYELSTVRKEEIDYTYLILLLQTQVPSDDNDEEEVRAQADPKLDREIEETLEIIKETRPHLAQVAKDLYEDMKANSEAFTNQDIGQVLQERLARIQQENIEDFAYQNAVDEDALTYYAINYQPGKEGKQYGERELLDRDKINTEEYNKRNKTDLNTFRIRSKLRKDLPTFVEEEISPYDVY